MGKYIDIVEPRGSQFSYTNICVEVDLENHFPVGLNLTLGEWKHC